jgi:hypothetical protein
MPAPLFNARYHIVSAVAGGTADFVTNGLFFDETSAFTPADVAVGDRFYDAVGNAYEIAVINTTIPLNCDVTDLEAAGAPTGPSSIYRPSETALATPVPTRTTNGITEFLQNHMRNVSIQDSSQDDEREQFVLTAPQIAAMEVVLAAEPLEGSIKLFVSGQGNQIKGEAWEFSGPTTITWSGLSLDGQLSVGQLIEVTYMEK